MATFGDLKHYVERAPGWVEEPNFSRGRSRTGDHLRYSKEMPNGSRLRTKVSKHPREEIGDDLFKHILRDQLRVTEDEFWSVVRRHSLDQEEPGKPATVGLPGWLVTCLIEVAGLPEDEVLGMTPEAAEAAWETFITGPRG